MQPPPPGSHPHPQPPAPPATASDEILAAALRTRDTARTARPVAVLTARHWRPVFDYASVVTPSPEAASLLTTAAFGTVLDELRRVRTTAALRPLLLTAARRTGAAWAADGQVAALPGLRHPGTGRAVPAVIFTGDGDRALTARAFRTLPGADQTLLWHTEAEGEGVSVPAALLAVDPRTAAARREPAREAFRAAVLRAHRELAPDDDCRHYNKLLDAAVRRGGSRASAPGLAEHLAHCSHCRLAAGQLDHTGGRLGLLLAEALLGRAARPYYDSRPARRRLAALREGTAEGAPAGARDAGDRAPGRRSRRRPRSRTVAAARTLLSLRAPADVRAPADGHAPPDVRAPVDGRTPAPAHTSAPARTPPPVRTSAPGLRRAATGSRARRPRRPGPAAALLAGAAALAGLALVAAFGPDLRAGDGRTARAHRPPVPGTEAPPSTGPAPPAGPFTARLRHTASGLCLDIRDGIARRGADAVTEICAGRLSQRWTYEADGLLRNAAAPALCLDSGLPDGVLALSPCDREPRPVGGAPPGTLPGAPNSAPPGTPGTPGAGASPVGGPVSGGSGSPGDGPATPGAGTSPRGAATPAGEGGGLRLRYTLTSGGELLARRDDRLAVVPAAPGVGARAVVRLRGGEDDAPARRWRAELSPAPPGSPAPAS
ncbi:ricin-type beta-trefoil lectin domain protein [Streptomyces sp. NPDC003691]